jgi:tetratricopeptide (TPR) repeat protein
MIQKSSPSNEKMALMEEMKQITDLLHGLTLDALDGTYRQLIEEISRDVVACGSADGFDAAREILDGHWLSLQLLNQVLIEAMDLLQRLEVTRQQRDKYSSNWWEQTTVSLQEAFRDNPEIATLLWMKDYVEALIDWELSACQQLAAATYPFPDSLRGYALQIQLNDNAIQNGDYASALPMLENLLEIFTEPVYFDCKTQAALLSIFIGRIYQFRLDDPVKAYKFFQNAAHLIPDDGRPLAAKGVLRLTGDEVDFDSANHLFNVAMDKSPDEPDAFVGKAILAEARSRWKEADDWYQKSIQAVVDEPNLLIALNKLLAPGSGRLYLHLTRQLMQNDELEIALNAVRICRELSFQDGTSYPLRFAIALEADIRLAMVEDGLGEEEKNEVANLYLEAGKRYYWNRDALQAIELFEKVEDLQPSISETCFYLADALRVANHKQTFPYYQSKEKAQESLEIWNKGIERVGRLEKSQAWYYFILANIEHVLDRVDGVGLKPHRWRALLACEQAVLVDDEDEAAWEKLCNELNHQNLYENAKHAIRKSLELNENNPQTLIEYTSLLINTGNFTEAEEVYSKVNSLETLTEDQKVYYSTWLAMIEAYQERYSNALERIEFALERFPYNTFINTLCIDVYRMQGDFVNAREIAERIWNQRENPEFNPKSFVFAIMAYILGYFSEAIGIAKPYLDVASRRGDANLLTAVSYLAHGDMDKLDLINGLTQNAIKLANDVRSLIDIDQEFTLLEDRARQENYDHEEEIAAWLNRPEGPRELVEAKRQSLNLDASSPRLEYRTLLTDEVLGLPGSPSWLAAHAGLGRLNLEIGEVLDAKDNYQAMLPYVESFRELPRALEKVGL